VAVIENWTTLRVPIVASVLDFSSTSVRSGTSARRARNRATASCEYVYPSISTGIGEGAAGIATGAGGAAAVVSVDDVVVVDVVSVVVGGGGGGGGPARTP
jgi:hypothetical protein